MIPLNLRAPSSFAARRLARLLMAAALPLAGLSACGVTPAADGAFGDGGAGLADSLPKHAVVLLGEVHDNPDGHRLRTEAMASALRAGWRPAVAMEQFDRERQPALDEAMQSCRDAACVIDLASPGKSGWNWAYYQPVIELALQYRLPLLAVNLSRADAGRAMREGLGAVFTPEELLGMGLRDGPPPDLLKRQVDEVAEAHCGMLPASLQQGMAVAQIARDATMAWLIRRAVTPGRPLVLLAGNGHVRKDQGVPRWLPEKGILAVGYTEQPAPRAEYDRNVVVPAAQRPDPCKTLGPATFKKTPSPAAPAKSPQK